jgi:hypothetical protein
LRNSLSHRGFSGLSDQTKKKTLKCKQLKVTLRLSIDLVQRVLNYNAAGHILFVGFHEFFHHELILNTDNILVDNKHLLLEEALMYLYLCIVELFIETDNIFYSTIRLRIILVTF